MFKNIVPEFANVEIGAHLHTTPNTWYEKVDAAYQNGCRRFDGAIKGFGGCPMATDKLTGNMPTENLISYFTENMINNTINQKEFNAALIKAVQVFPQ